MPIDFSDHNETKAGAGRAALAWNVAVLDPITTKSERLVARY